MATQFLAAALVISRLIALKGALMSADYRGDILRLAALRTEAKALSGDRELGYLADYWSGFASWRIVVNGASAKMTPEEAKTNLNQAVADFESSLTKKSDFADAYASAAAVHGWLAMYKMSDPDAMKREIETFKQQINRALELQPTNPRVLWIEAIPYATLPKERGGSTEKAVALYQAMLDNAAPLVPDSPLPDWGRAEALMSLAYTQLNQRSPDLDAAMSNAKAAIRLQPEWHYVKDILIPQIEAKGKGAQP